MLPRLLGIKHFFCSRIQYSYVFRHLLFIICLVPNQVTMSIISILSCHLLKFPQSCDIIASYPERFLVTVTIFENRHSLICYYSAMHQILNYEILFTFFKPCGLWSFIRVCHLNCASLKLSIQVTACSHISHSVFCGAGVLELSSSRWIITFKMKRGFSEIFSMWLLYFYCCACMMEKVVLPAFSPLKRTLIWSGAN